MKKFVRNNQYILFLILIVSFFSFSFFSISQINFFASAGGSHNLKGFAWSSNIGWVSFNSKDCDTDGDGTFEGIGEAGGAAPTGCPTNGTAHDYGVNIDIATGNFSGNAWSSGVGWIDFAPAEPYPAAPNNSAHYDSATGQVDGWAKILTLGDEGWIRLNNDFLNTQWHCAINSQDYADQTTCNTACVQTANCDLNNVSFSGNACSHVVCGTANSNYGFPKISASGNKIDFYKWDGLNLGGVAGTININGATATGDVYQIRPFDPNPYAVGRIVASGNTLNFYGYYYGWQSIGTITLDGITASGEVCASSIAICGGAHNFNDIIEVVANGNKLDFYSYYVNGFNQKIRTYINSITFSDNVYSCPLPGGSACSGTPQTCSASQACTQNNINESNGVTINAATGDFSGWGWNGSSAEAGIGWISFNSKDCDQDNNTFIDAACGGDNATTPSYDYKVVLGVTNSAPTVSNLTAPNWSITQAGAIKARQAFLRWQFNDTDADSSQSAYEVIIDNNSDFSSPILSTGKTAGSASQLMLDQTELDYNTPYYWKIRVWDDKDTPSNWFNYDTSPDTDNDDANIPTFTVYEHEMPDPDFSWYPASPSKDENVKLTDSSKVYLSADPSTAINCDEANCDWLWTAPGATITNPTASSTIIKFNSEGSQPVTLKITDTDGYYYSVTKNISVKSKLPGWKETK